jgi:DNA-binding Xre family transcriptional regulator
MTSQQPPLLHIYARNVQHLAFKRGWSHSRLATELGVTLNTLNRVRFARGRYIDPEVFVALLDLFGCDPNDLLSPQPGIDYAVTN